MGCEVGIGVGVGCGVGVEWGESREWGGKQGVGCEGREWGVKVTRLTCCCCRSWKIKRWLLRHVRVHG